MENDEGLSSSAKNKCTSKATACLLTNTQKQKIQSSRCTRSNVKRESIDLSDQFIVKETTTPFVTFNPQYPWFVKQKFVWRYKRAVDLNTGIGLINNKIIRN